MPDPVSAHSGALSRRDFLKITLGVALIVAWTVYRRTGSGAPAALSSRGYGSGRYGAGIYGLTARRYAIFLPEVRNK